MENSFASQSFLGLDSEEILDKARVAVVGLSGGGSHIVQQLAHVGVGDLLLIDYDRVEHKNLNRMVGASLQDADLAELKTKVMADVIHRVRPRAQVLESPARWQESAELLRDRDVIFGCVDKFSERQQLEATARRYLIPYIDIGMDVHPVGNGFTVGGQVVLSMPGQPCLRCLGIVSDNRLRQEAAMYGAAGNNPQVVWANGTLASLAVGFFVQLLCPWHDSSPQTILREYDGDSHTVSASNKMIYVQDAKCTHYSDVSILGDPSYEPLLQTFV
jgi:hypothetical protein